ncbi:MAG TPA: FKBP-type peptidyl-prolyl cis-trans isomerase [Candidatus Saccharimonas sp.]|nr:FKBP-type peptidyl-prolyl cis-trans isomerase [Candidatus Saccharimonas sp.]
MSEVTTKKSTRIIILIIAIVMAGGFIGSYFLIIMNQSSQNNTPQNQTQTSNNDNYDPTAFKASGPVTQLQIVDEKVGTGAEVKTGDSVRVHYKGTIAQTGMKFDSSYDRGEPVTFPLSQVIQAWQQGIPGMKVGGKRRLVVPAALAYGAQAQPGIPANSDLVFEVELLAITPPQQPKQ